MDSINADLDDAPTPLRFFIVTLKCVAAGCSLATGVALLPLPGLSLPWLAAGVMILATEFDWAEQLEARAVALWQRLRREPPVVDFSITQR